MNNLIDINNLKELLGYADLRSVRTYCKNNNVPIIVLGRKSYVHEAFLNDLVLEKLSSYVNEKYDNPEGIMYAIKNNMKPRLSKAIKQQDNSSKRSGIKRNKIIHSKAANDLLNAVHSAK